MSQISASSVRTCYEAALAVRLKRVGPTEAVRQASGVAKMNHGSALDYVYNVRRLLDGRSYTRTMNPEGTGLILSWIAQDFGDDTARHAAKMVLEHVTYYAALPRGGPQQAVREVAESFLASLTISGLDGLVAWQTTELAVAMARTPVQRAARLAAADPTPRTATVTTTVFLRNADVVVETLLRAKGICEGCARPAPFDRLTDNTPYLEVHHRIPLAQHGPDIVENAIALCPNCHREAHHGQMKARFLPTQPN